MYRSTFALLPKFYHKKISQKKTWKLLAIEKSAEILREREVKNCIIGHFKVRQKVLC